MAKILYIIANFFNIIRDVRYLLSIWISKKNDSKEMLEKLKKAPALKYDCTYFGLANYLADHESLLDAIEVVNIGLNEFPNSELLKKEQVRLYIKKQHLLKFKEPGNE